jgi:hypothetical protein
MAQNRWATALDPMLSNPVLNTVLLKNVALTTGANIVNHKLGRDLQGWYPVRVRSSSTIYDTQDSNQTPQLTLLLVASANVTVDLVVF